MRNKTLLLVVAIMQLLLFATVTRAQNNPSVAEKKTGKVIFLSIYVRDNGSYRATFDTDSQSVNGLNQQALNDKFSRFGSLANILNFVRQEGYKVVSFTPTQKSTFQGTGGGDINGYLIVLESSY